MLLPFGIFQPVVHTFETMEKLYFDKQGDNLQGDVFAFLPPQNKVHGSLHTPLLNGPLAKNRDQRSGILHIARDPLGSPKMLLVRSES